MATVKDIFEYINTIAPTYMKESWDNVGLNCGRMDKEVKTILVALDPFEGVCQEAAQIGADLLVTHHALLWNPGFITDETQQGKNTLFLIEKGIPCINAHTNLDCAPGGVNDTLAQVLGLKDVHVVKPVGTDEEGREYGLLRCGIVDEQPLDTFLAHVKNTLGCEGLRYVSGKKPITKVAVGGGSCGDSLYRIRELGYDALVTADCKYNQFADAAEYGITLIDAGHFQTENPVCAYLAEKLREAFPHIEVIESKVHKDHIRFA